MRYWSWVLAAILTLPLTVGCATEGFNKGVACGPPGQCCESLRDMVHGKSHDCGHGCKVPPGTMGQVSYPYYTLRGPRDFLQQF